MLGAPTDRNIVVSMRIFAPMQCLISLDWSDVVIKLPFKDRDTFRAGALSACRCRIDHWVRIAQSKTVLETWPGRHDRGEHVLVRPLWLVDENVAAA